MLLSVSIEFSFNGKEILKADTDLETLLPSLVNECAIP